MCATEITDNVNRFNKSSFAKHNFVSHGQQRVPHVVFNLGNELDSVHEQELKQLLADIPLVSTEFALDVFNK